MINKYINAKACFIGIITSCLLTACGGGSGGGDDDGGGGASPGLQGTVFASIQATSGSNQAPFSNEIQKTLTNSSLIATWDEPTRALDNSCLSANIDKYVISYGFTSGDYSETLEIIRVGGGVLSLNCSDSSASSDVCDQIIIENCTCSTPTNPATDTKCGETISSCSCTITLPVT